MTGIDHYKKDRLMTKKYAVFSMDIEDWYHLDYFAGHHCDRTYSMLDGLYAYQQLIEVHQICSSFFVLGEIIHSLKSTLRQLSAQGHDIGIHGWNHVRPLTMGIKEFEKDIRSCKHELEDALGRPVIGYRAPCFSFDRERLDIIEKVGIAYDSSRILFGGHPLYGELDVQGFQEILPGIYRHGGFFEFEISTLPFAGNHIPVSGGGYIRIIPWMIMKRLINRYIERQQLYVLYIHPFEMSSLPCPDTPQNTSFACRHRFAFGRKSVFGKLNHLIMMLKSQGFEFMTFSALRQNILQEQGIK